MKKNLIIFLLSSSILSASIIPDSLYVDWTNAGAKEKIEHQFEYSAIGLGLDNTGNQDNSTELNRLIDSVDKPCRIIFEPGVYLFNSTISMSDGVSLVGYSSEKTYFKFNMGQRAINCINISGIAKNDFYDVYGGCLKGSDFLLTKDDHQFSIGNYIELRQANGSWDINPISWAEFSVGQVLSINRINGDTLFLNETIRLTYEDSLKPEIRKLNPIQNSSIKYINIERLDEPETGAGYNIFLNLAVNCIISGIESYKSVGSHVMINLSKNISLEGGYIHHAFTYDGSGTRGYGVTLNEHASDCLIENNIFQYLRHAMMVKHGANGNVFSCNYSREPNRTEPISDLAGDISLHGHYPFANLFESNIIQNIYIDEYWGPSGPYNTFFRNRAELYGIINTSEMTDTLLFIGNETVNKQFLKGIMSVVGEGHFIYGNNILDKITPSGTDVLNDSSLFYADKPHFWDITDPFPSIGRPHELNEYSIPAKNRFENAAKKTVGEYMPLSVDAKIENSILIFNGHIKFEIEPPSKVSIYNSNGEMIYSSNKELNQINHQFISPGIFFLAKRSGSKTTVTKILNLK